MSTLAFEIGRSLAGKPACAQPAEKSAAGLFDLGRSLLGGLGRTGKGLWQGGKSLASSAAGSTLANPGRAALGAVGTGYGVYRGHQAIYGQPDQHRMPSNWDDPSAKLTNEQIGEYAGRNAGIVNDASRDLQSEVNQAWQGDDYEKALELQGHQQAGRYYRQLPSLWSRTFGTDPGPTRWGASPDHGIVGNVAAPVGAFARSLGHALAPNVVDANPPSAQQAHQNLNAASGALDRRYGQAARAFRNAPTAIRQRMAVLQQQLQSGGLTGPARAEAEQSVAMLRSVLERAVAAPSSKDIDRIRSIRGQYGLGNGPELGAGPTPYWNTPADPGALALFGRTPAGTPGAP